MTDLEEVYRKHSADVYRFALYLSGNAGIAEDITSETFVRVWRQRGEIRVATVKAYLLTIARHLYLRGRRHAARQVELPPVVPDGRPGLDQWVHGRQELEAVLRALQELPEVDRAAVLMRVDDVPYEDIAEALEVSVAAAKVRVHRARARLARSRRTPQ
jgi:RNA polymerase sigma-70 factor (ECF subfamily)